MKFHDSLLFRIEIEWYYLGLETDFRHAEVCEERVLKMHQHFLKFPLACHFHAPYSCRSFELEVLNYASSTRSKNKKSSGQTVQDNRFWQDYAQSLWQAPLAFMQESQAPPEARQVC